MSRHWIFFVMLLVPMATAAQKVDGAWLSTDGVCMEFHPTSDLLMLEPHGDQGWGNPHDQRYEYALRKDRLIIKGFHNQILLCWLTKEQCEFRIDALTPDQMRLTLVKEKNGESLMEILQSWESDTEIFRRLPIGCMEHWFPGKKR